MRHQRKLIISVLAFMLLAGISVISSTTRLTGNIVEAQSPPPPPPGDLVPLYHFVKYSPDVYGPYTTNEAAHYYAAGEEGKKNAEKFHYILTDQGTRPQGVEGYVSLKELPGTVPLYYINNKDGGELRTTMPQAKERASFESLGYVPQTPGVGTVPLYGLSCDWVAVSAANPNKPISHTSFFYTTDKETVRLFLADTVHVWKEEKVNIYLWSEGTEQLRLAPGVLNRIEGINMQMRKPMPTPTP